MDVFIDVVWVLDPTYLSEFFPLSGDGMEDGRLSSGFVHGNGIRCAVLINKFFEVATSCSIVPIGSKQGATVRRLQHPRGAALEERAPWSS
ncbi:hypothetical protein EVC45_08575 [Paraburkholderia sp. UYCP14C]|uniref:hypothetical protein n=1 Tax=Paraburkholderia sp. UYCP14C TaxID=2511130 RepID=UPI00101F32D8|nr:hypothetical protein [Paraburkholderia sp. UYCP14C]RZF30061.1 hypothetical protein EVC45_08575 [Paraburkholderia sp. UYCP14C]